jgi:hypothetical protein
VSFDSNGRALDRIKANHPILRGALPGMVRRDPGDLSIGTGDFTQGIPAFWFARSIEMGSSENLLRPYAESPWVRSAIKHVAGPIANCELLFSRPTTAKVRTGRRGLKQLSTARGIIYRSADELLDLPQIAEWLKEPVRDLSYQDFVEGSIGWYKMSECMWVFPPNQPKLPFPEASPNPYGQIKIVNPGQLRPKIEDDEIVSWTWTRKSGGTITLDPSQVIRLRGWNPYDEFRGLGDYRAAHLAAEADWLASKFSRNIMANNGDCSRLISVKGGIANDAQKMQILQSLKERREASLRGQAKDVVVGGDVEIQNAELASVDASFIGQRLENRHEVYIAMGVPPSMADIAASYSIGSASDMFRLLINTCIPTGGKYCGALERLIYRLTGQRVEVGLNWDEHPCMQEVRKERLDSIAKLAAQGMPMEQIDEYLSLGLVEFPGWEVGYLPINVQPVLNEDGEVTPAPAPGDFNEDITDGETDEPGEQPISDGSDTPAEGDAPEVKAMLAALRSLRPKARSPEPKAAGKNQKLWESHMRLRSAAVKQYQSKVSRILNDYRAKALKHLHVAHSKTITAKSLVDVIFDPAAFRRDLTKGLDPITSEVLQRAGDELMAEIGRKDDPWKIAPRAAKDFQAGRNKLLAKVGDTVNSQINTTLVEGLDKGETTEQLAARVKSVFNSLTNAEARRIAMTETSASYGFSRNLAMVDAGIEYKAWLTSGGDNVREAHAQAGEDYSPSNPIPVTDAFNVDGEELMFPGDENGSPGNVINCHCIQLAVAEPK